MSLWHSAARAHSLLPTLSAARRAYTRRLKENPVRRRLTTEAEDLTKPEDVVRLAQADACSSAMRFGTSRPSECCVSSHPAPCVRQRRGKSWDMVSAAEDLTSPQPREHGCARSSQPTRRARQDATPRAHARRRPPGSWDFYVWMGVVTLIPPALAVLVGEYGRYDMKQAEARDERAPVPRCVCCAPVSSASRAR